MSSGGNGSPPISPPDSPFIDFVNMAIKELKDDDVEKAYMEVMEAHAAESSRSTTRKRRTIQRDREDGDKRLWNDYFSGSVYPESYFRRRFRMSKQLFNRIVDGVSNHSPYFQQRYDCTGKKGLSPIQKCTAAIRQLANGTSADLCDEYIRIGETTAAECLQNFCRCVVEVFSKEYLRRPNASDIQRIMEAHASKHGFPGMLGSIDCMHWAWKNCPVAWKGQYTRGDHGYPTIMLEAVASYDLWIWHAYFGVAGSNNDINVLNQSPIFNEVLQGNAPPCNFTVNGTPYTIGYYLADGIYPEWATLVKSFTYPQTDKMNEFKKRHESARKDVERAFGVLQARWAIVRGPARATGSSTQQKRQPWSSEEEELLTKAWLHISNDCIIGNSQRNNDFWRRVHVYFEKGCNVVRETSAIRSHWHMIKQKVSLFNGFYIQLRKQKISGCSDDQLLRRAREMYKASQNAQFMYDHVWILVKDEPKWKEQTGVEHNQSLSGKRTIDNISSEANNYFDLNDDNEVIVEDYGNKVEELPRPTGTKKAKAMAKAKAKGKAKADSSQINEVIGRFQNITEMKESAFVNIETKMGEYVEIKRKDVQAREQEIALREQEIALREQELLFKDTTYMNHEQLAFHKKICAKIMAKYDL